MKEKLNCILLVDDDEPTNFLSTLLIEEANCTQHLEITESGKKALDYLCKSKKENDGAGYFHPDLIFLDINMPCMNGWEFLEKYQGIKNRLYPCPVIIMLTTSLDPDDKQKALNIVDVAGFEHKPLTREMLERIIKNYCTPENKLPKDAPAIGNTRQREFK